MAMIHNLAHRLQESYGIRICVFCRTLTGNRGRPIAFQLGRKYRQVADRELGSPRLDHPNSG